jgi:ELWxxDGT repeat protein
MRFSTISFRGARSIILSSIIVLNFFLALSLTAQPTLLSDVNSYNSSSGISAIANRNMSYVSFNGALYFAAASESFGQELWKTDGSVSGTKMVKDIYPGVTSSLVGNLTLFNGSIYFIALHGGGNDLWKSDGTEDGTMSVDIEPIPSSAAGELITIGGNIYFLGAAPESGWELWKSDGTANGTHIVKDIIPGPESGMVRGIANLTNVNGVLFFTTNDGKNGMELWKTDGTDAGTVMVKDINPGNGSTTFSYLTAINNKLFFSADIDGFPHLWKSDGTDPGTSIVNNNLAFTGRVFLFKNEIYFGAISFLDGRELWKTDGTESGTVLIKDINPGFEQSMPWTPGIFDEFAAIGDHLFFAAEDGSNKIQLWKTNGTPEGTSMVKKINPSDHSSPRNFTVVNGTLYFSAAQEGSSANSKFEIWKSDGTEAGTTLVKEINPTSGSNPTALREANGLLYFAANDGILGNELWRSDGTESGTFLLSDINKESDFYPVSLVPNGNDLFFINRPDAKGYQIWNSDGTDEGTALVRDINPATLSFQINATNVDGKLFFSIDDIAHGYELWVSDGTPTGTKIVKDIYPGPMGSGAGMSLGGSFSAIGAEIFFTADDGVNGLALWRSDGTQTGTVLVKDLDVPQQAQRFITIGNTLYFFIGSRLFKSDGTTTGTVLIKTVNTLNPGANVTSLVNNNGTLYFTIDDGIHGRELWKSDGTDGGTVMVKDIYPKTGIHFMAVWGAYNGIAYMTASDDVNGYELWKSDGTEEGTSMVKDISTGALSSSPVGFNAIGDSFYFYATDPDHGRELWRSDGTQAGTILVKDIAPGTESSRQSLENLTALKGVLYFFASEGKNGVELWRSDGTEVGTYLVDDINPAFLSSSPINVVAGTDVLYFTALDDTHGREVWIYDPSFQSITFQPISGKIATDVPFALSATASSGLPVTFTVVSGPASINDNVVTLNGGGTITIKASQYGNEQYRPALDVQRAFSVSKVEQTILFAAIDDKHSDDEPFAVEASASSALLVSFTIVSGPAKIAGDLVTVTGDGAVTVRASQSGNEKFNAAPDVEQSFNVALILAVESGQMSMIRVFPNPSNEFLNVEMAEPDLSMVLMNNTGQPVWHGQRMRENDVVINVKNFPTGIYLLKVTGKNGSFTKKIIVD